MIERLRVHRVGVDRLAVMHHRALRIARILIRQTLLEVFIRRIGLFALVGATRRKADQRRGEDRDGCSHNSLPLSVVSLKWLI